MTQHTRTNFVPSTIFRPLKASYAANTWSDIVQAPTLLSWRGCSRPSALPAQQGCTLTAEPSLLRFGARSPIFQHCLLPQCQQASEPAAATEDLGYCPIFVPAKPSSHSSSVDILCIYMLAVQCQFNRYLIDTWRSAGRHFILGRRRSACWCLHVAAPPFRQNPCSQSNSLLS